jgi:cytochrome P450
MMGLTFSIVGDTLFGSELRAEADQIREALSISTEIATDRTVALIKFPYSWPTPANLRMKRATDRLKKLARDILTKRIEDQKKGEVHKVASER